MPSTDAPLAGLSAAAGVAPALTVAVTPPVDAVAAIRPAAADEVGVGASAFFGEEQAVIANRTAPQKAVSGPMASFMRRCLSAPWLRCGRGRGHGGRRFT